MQVSDSIISSPKVCSRVRGGWLFALSAAILPFLLLAYYNYPSIHDDYSNSNQIIRFGRAQFIKDLYASWTGRYTELTLKAYLDPLSYQQTELLARVQPIAVILLLVLAAFCFFRLLLRGAHNSAVLACALLLTVVYMNGFAMAGSAFYWFGGYTSFTAGVIASLFSFACLVGLHRYQGYPAAQLVCLVVGVLFSIIAIGAYDVVMMAICWVLGSVTALVFLLNHSSKWWFTAFFALAMIGTFFAVTAPGNQVRAAMEDRNLGQIVMSPQIIVIFIKSIYFAATQCVSWANSLLLLLGSALLAGLLTRMRDSLCLDLNCLHPALLALWLLGGVAAMVFLSTLVYQNVWPHSWQCVYFYFMCGWVWLLATIVARYNVQSEVSQALSSATGWRLTALAFLGLCFFSSTSNTHMAFLDIAARAPEHYARVRQREQLIKKDAARQARVTEIRPLYSNEDAYRAPSVLYTYEFNYEDASQYAIYYGIDSVVIKPNPYHP